MKRIDLIDTKGDIREHLTRDEAWHSSGHLTAEAKTLCGRRIHQWQKAPTDAEVARGCIGNRPCLSCHRVERMLGRNVAILAKGFDQNEGDDPIEADPLRSMTRAQGVEK